MSDLYICRNLKEIRPLILQTPIWFNWLKVRRIIFHFQTCKHVSGAGQHHVTRHISLDERLSVCQEEQWDSRSFSGHGELSWDLRSQGQKKDINQPLHSPVTVALINVVNDLFWPPSVTKSYCSFIFQSAGNGREWERWGDKLSYIAINFVLNDIGNTTDIDTAPLWRT